MPRRKGTGAERSPSLVGGALGLGGAHSTRPAIRTHNRQSAKLTQFCRLFRTTSDYLSQFFDLRLRKRSRKLSVCRWAVPYQAAARTVPPPQYEPPTAGPCFGQAAALNKSAPNQSHCRDPDSWLDGSMIKVVWRSAKISFVSKLWKSETNRLTLLNSICRNNLWSLAYEC